MLYYLNNNDKKELKMLKRTTLQSLSWREKDLEILLTENMDRLLDEENLMPIFTERSFQEEPDIMALDKKGKLYIFELKRWEGKSENLLQVLRYGQIYGQKSYEELEADYFKFNKTARSLLEEHSEYFNLAAEEKLTKEQFNKEQHFLIVTDGTDLNTRNAINYWKSTGLNIDSIVYRVYITSEKEQIIEFDTYSPYQDVIEQESANYILNTNYNNNQQSHEDMLNQGKAAAYYHPWKHKIKRIEKGDKVFLYQSRKGIVAMGVGTGTVHQATYQGNPNEEFYMKLDDFAILREPLTAAKMKEITKSNFMFNQTMFSIGQERGDMIWKFIKENLL